MNPSGQHQPSRDSLKGNDTTARHACFFFSLRKESGAAPFFVSPPAESASSARRAQRELQETSAYPRSMGAPLPGGMPLVPSFGSQAAAHSTSRRGVDPSEGSLPPLNVVVGKHFSDF